ncbi:MAG: hypothetical protein JXA77_13915 [Bacteroidales bacterium]|nr:hypothetical protein [Bacteroidales bacterium]MBN2819199.1 hypothetical protein [Bacteroidales bacterium]
MRKIIIFFFGVFTLFSSVKSQELLIEGRVNIKLSHFRYGIPKETKYWNYNNGKSCYWVEVNYGIQKYIETGVYLGYTRFFDNTVVDIGESFNPSEKNTFGYSVGANINFHIIPFLINEDDFRFDAYLSTKAGLTYFTFSEGSDYLNKAYFRYGTYCGVSFYLLNNLGLYSEFGYGNEGFLKFGLSFKF